MRRTLRYFMWGFQPQFRMSIQSAAESLLKQLGMSGKTQVILVGFAATPEATWPICVEPEHRHFQPEHLAGVGQRATELYRANPRSEMFYSDPRAREQVHSRLKDGSRAQAVEEALEREAPDDMSYFAALSSRVGDYHVHTVLGIPSHALQAVPQLRTAERDDVPVTRSIVHGAIAEVLKGARQALFQPDAGESLRVLSASTDELARRAAARFIASAVHLSGSYYGDALFSALTSVSTTRYEGESGFGTIIATAQDDAELVIEVKLRSPIRVSDTRALRKLLQISDRNRVGLLTDGNEVFGLGRVRASADPVSERIFQFDIIGDGRWLMRHADSPLLAVDFGNPRIPKPRIDKARFVDTATRIFPPETVDAERLWKLTLAATEQAHGAMLVVSAAADQEASRLAAQAILIEEAELSPELLYQATGIDGAVLFAPDGTCHALGVILDGTASDDGDRSRGSRFNSAVRYLASDRPPAMIVLVSEDGMIDVLPRLRPRIPREFLNDALERYQRLTTAEEVDHELRADAFDRLEELAFYLSTEECELINQLEAAFQDRELAQGGFGIQRRPFQRHPDLDDSYFT